MKGRYLYLSIKQTLRSYYVKNKIKIIMYRGCVNENSQISHMTYYQLVSDRKVLLFQESEPAEQAYVLVISNFTFHVREGSEHLVGTKI